MLGEEGVQPEYDRVTQASMNGLYVKAKELDRGHNECDAPLPAPPGAVVDAQTHPSDAEAHPSDAQAHTSDAEAHTSDR